MVRHASLFSQLVSLFNRQRFYELVYRHRSERYAKRVQFLGSICGHAVLPISPSKSVSAKRAIQLIAGSIGSYNFKYSNWTLNFACPMKFELCSSFCLIQL